MYKALKKYKNHWEKGDIVGINSKDAEQLIEDGFLIKLTPEQERTEYKKIKERVK